MILAQQPLVNGWTILSTVKINIETAGVPRATFSEDTPEQPLNSSNSDLLFLVKNIFLFSRILGLE